MSNQDIRLIIKDWPYDPDKITVRKILGDDGREKVQMRVDLGVLQMEAIGRPDGQKPHGCESLLHYHREQLEKYIEVNGSDVGFELTTEECRALREEAFMYYQRYLSAFVLEDFEAVVRDTQRNLDVLDLCNQCGANQNDRFFLEQYRPYILMMNTRARAFLAENNEDLRSALQIVEDGIEKIGQFFEDFDQPETLQDSQEIQILQALRDELEGKQPLSPSEALNRRLQTALVEERYEEAARIRDEIKKLSP